MYYCFLKNNFLFDNSFENLCVVKKSNMFNKILNFGRFKYPLLTSLEYLYYVPSIGVNFFNINGARRLFNKHIKFSFRLHYNLFPIKHYNKVYGYFYKIFFNSFSKIYTKLCDVFFQSAIKFLEFNLVNFYNHIMFLMVNFTVLLIYPISNIIINEDKLSLVTKRIFCLLTKLKRKRYNIIV